MNRILWLAVFALIFATTPSVVGAFGPAGAPAAGSSPELSRDLAISLRVPLFEPVFATMPVASIGQEDILLGDITPALQKEEAFLFWTRETEPAELSRQFQEALNSRLAARSGEGEEPLVFVDSDIRKGPVLMFDVPLFRANFADLPVALIADEPITVAEFAADLGAIHQEAEGEHAHSGPSENIKELIERMVAVRLVEHEARNIGFDQTPTFRKLVENYAQKTLLYALLDAHIATLKLDDAAVESLYRKISLEGKFESFRFEREEDVKRVVAAYEEGKDYQALIDEVVANGRAQVESQEGFVKFSELLPNVAQEAAKMEVGTLSQPFRQADGFLLFILQDRRFVEDPNARLYAARTVGEQQRARAGTEYIRDIVERYGEFDEKIREELDFEKIAAANPDITVEEALKPLLEDQRILVKVEGVEPVNITVGEVAQKLKETYFHGTDVPLNPDELNIRKGDILEDRIFRLGGTLEAQRAGLDQTEAYLEKIKEFERKTLFDMFMQKVVMPEVQLQEEDVRNYYQEHLADYQTPAMFKLRSLPFYREADALNAVEKLRRGSDFKWVSANVEGLASIQDEDLLQFDRNILSLAALPENLQKQAEDARPGDILLHEGEDRFFYVLQVDNVFPPQAKPYEQVRDEILKLVYQEKIQDTLDEWVENLKGAYETRVFLDVEGV